MNGQTELKEERGGHTHMHARRHLILLLYKTLLIAKCSRFPFYSEIKILLLLYLVSPITKGSGIIYRRYISRI